MVPHVIRLHSAWQSAAVGSSGEIQQTLARSFGRPTGLTAVESVWLVIDPALLEAEVVCNGHGLRPLDQAGAPLEFNITSLLSERNELRLAAGWLPTLPVIGRGISLPEGLVTLEIRREAWIKDLRLTIVGLEERDAALVLAGEVVVRAEASSLSLLALSQGRELAYRDVVAGEFRLDAAASEMPRWKLGERNALVDLELRLVAAGNCCWQARLPVAASPPVEVFDRAALEVSGQRFAWPTNGQPLAPGFEPAAFARGLAETGPLVALSRVLPHAFYQACDELGVGVLQQWPPGTSRGVLHQLLRHPSILAWRAQGAIDEPPVGNRPAPAGLQ